MNRNAFDDLHNVFHRGTYKVLCKTSLEDIKKELTFVIEKYSECSIKIIISDERDPCFLCVLVLTRNDYDELKKQQGLLIDFDSFPAQLVRLLQQSISGNMFLSLQQHGNMNIFLEIIEHNEFKRLVHLSLKTGPASDSDVKKNMADNILILKKNLSELSAQILKKENLFQEKEQIFETKVKDLNIALSRIKEERIQNESEFQDTLKKEKDKLEQERLEWKRCAELCSQTQTNSMQEALTKKDKQLEDNTARCRQLQETLKSLESQITDKGQRILSLEKQLHTARTDAETWRNQNGALDREYHDKELNLQQTRTRLMDVEKNLKDKSDMLRDALDSLQSMKREKVSLEEKLSSLEILAAKHQTEAQSSGEQLIKANQIISKLNTDLLEMREKLMCRTAIALEQEKVIERHLDEMSNLKKKEKDLLDEIEKVKLEAERIKLEIETQKRIISDKEEIIKNNHSVIQWLHKKLDAAHATHDITSGPTSRGVCSSTPFLSSHNFTEKIEGQNNDLINAYTAGLNAKNIGHMNMQPISSDNSTSNSIGNGINKTQYGLDPVYLKPTEFSSRTSIRSKSQDSSKSSSLKRDDDSVKSKTENRTKQGKSFQTGRATQGNKSDRSATPISAYFSRS